MCTNESVRLGIQLGFRGVCDLSDVLAVRTSSAHSAGKGLDLAGGQDPFHVVGCVVLALERIQLRLGAGRLRRSRLLLGLFALQLLPERFQRGGGLLAWQQFRLGNDQRGLCLLHIHVGLESDDSCGRYLRLQGQLLRLRLRCELPRPHRLERGRQCQLVRGGRCLQPLLDRRHLGIGAILGSLNFVDVSFSLPALNLRPAKRVLRLGDLIRVLKHRLAHVVRAVHGTALVWLQPRMQNGLRVGGLRRPQRGLQKPDVERLEGACVAGPLEPQPLVLEILRRWRARLLGTSLLRSSDLGLQLLDVSFQLLLVFLRVLQRLLRGLQLRDLRLFVTAQARRASHGRPFYPTMEP
mmetsp:Transcript_120962/g.342210  ORF Transcript_120962/g.342210 Transcript_120962/m.342210 type:complete len:352 (+) Transcript_120962:1854-2909(+)